MPRTAECDYCGADIEPGTGTMLVLTDGTTIDYCSAKCEKNADLGREARDLEWTAAGRAGTGEAAEDVSDEAGADAEDRDTDIEDQGQAVDAPGEETPDLEAAEEAAEDAPGPEGEGEDEAAADADADAAEAVDEDADEESEDADEESEDADEEEAEA